MADRLQRSDFLRDYLHASFVQHDTRLFALDGIPGDPISDRLDLEISGGDGANNQFSTDEIDPVGQNEESIPLYDSSTVNPLAEPQAPSYYFGNSISPLRDERFGFYEEVSEPSRTESEPDARQFFGVATDDVGPAAVISSGTGGVRVDTDIYKVVFFSFGFEAINSADGRALVMDRVLQWLHQEEVDLSITKEDSADPIVAGEQLTYTVTVTNKGPSDSTGVVVTDTLPDEVSFVSASDGCNESVGIVTYSIGNLSNSASTDLTINVDVDSSIKGTITNVVEVVGDQFDPDLIDNSHVEDTIVTPLCNLELGLSYVDSALTMDFTLGTAYPATWSTWLFIPEVGIFPLWSIPLPTIAPPRSFSLPISGFPSIGRIGFFTVLLTSEGVSCFDFGMVDTGLSSSVGLSSAELQELFPSPNNLVQDTGKLRR